MDTVRIIKNGYGQLARLLPANDVEYLVGYRDAIEDLIREKDEYDLINGVYSTIERIESEVSIDALDGAIEMLKACQREYLICAVENNDGYEIGEDGKIREESENGEGKVIDMDKVELPENYWEPRI